MFLAGDNLQINDTLQNYLSKFLDFFVMDGTTLIMTIYKIDNLIKLTFKKPIAYSF